MAQNTLPRTDPLSVLQRTVDFGPYAAAPGSPIWVRSLAALAQNNLGALALVGPSGINLTSGTGFRERSEIEAAALYLSALADTVAKSRQQLGLAYPPSARHLPLLFAVATVLSTALSCNNRSDSPASGPIFLVSPDLELRSSYCDVYVRNVSLDEAFPGTRLLPSGAVERLTPRSGTRLANGVCFCLPGLNLPTRLTFRPQLTILDLRCARWASRLETIVPWARDLGTGLLVIYTLGDVDAEQALHTRRIRTFSVDHTALTSVREITRPHGAAADWSLSAVAGFLNRTHEVREVRDGTTVDTALTQCLSLVEQASTAEPQELARINWILAALRQLPVPLGWYESLARNTGRSTVKRLIGQIGYRSQNNRAIGPVLQTLRMVLQSTYDSLEACNPRAEAIRSEMATLLTTIPAEKILVIVRDRLSERALRTWLEMEAFADDPRVASVGIHSGASLNTTFCSQADCAVINGALPRRYRWVHGAALGRRVVYLAYPHEYSTIDRQLSYFYESGALKARAEERVTTLKAMPSVSGFVPAGGAAESIHIPKLSLQIPRVPVAPRSAKPLASTTSLDGLGDLLSDLKKVRQAPPTTKPTPIEDLAGEEAPEDVVGTDPSPDVESVSCVLVSVQSQSRGLGALYLRADRPVECVRPSQPDSVTRLLPGHLKQGDVLPRMEDGGRVTLFETIVSLVEQQPHMRFAAAARRQWQSAITAVRHKYGSASPALPAFEEYSTSLMDFTALLRDLRKAGATIETEQTVRNWITGETIAPDSVASIAAVGKVSGVDSVSRNARDLDRVFHQIRGVHQGIGRRIASAIRHSCHRFAQASAEPLASELDEHLALPISELVEHIEFVEVIAVESTARVPPHRVWQFVKR